VSGDKPVVIDVPSGYAHSITNTGTCDMVMVIWANQIFDPQKPDTYPMEVRS
jgi:UDP-2-acetamido-2,6-beta-L-arabino-hexul-4-ose reductase